MRTELIIEDSLKALARAQTEYDKWTNEPWWRLPEYFATMCIARAITKNDATYVALEYKPKDTILVAQGNLQGRHGTLSRLDGRFDIVVWNTTEPRGVVEVKSSPYQYDSINKDVKRICTTLRRAKSIRWGLIAYSMVASKGKRKGAKDRLTHRTESIERTVLDNLNDKFTLKRYSSPVRKYADDGARTAEVLKISRARK